MTTAQGNVAPDPRAEAFVAARRAGVALACYPGVMPASEVDAYALQDAAIALWDDRVAGWKVGLIQPPYDARLGRTRLFGPIFARNILDAGDTQVRFGCIAGGFAAVEAEYVLRLGGDVRPETGWTTDAAMAQVDGIFAGVELAASPFAGINDHGPLVTISDFGNNAGLIVGQELALDPVRLAGLRCSVAIDGVMIGTGGPGCIPGGPIGSLVALLDHCGRRRQALAAGTLVSTGAATGVHVVTPGQDVVADFGGGGRIRIAVEPLAKLAAGAGVMLAASPHAPC